jgi:hypothetical protein
MKLSRSVKFSVKNLLAVGAAWRHAAPNRGETIMAKDTKSVSTDILLAEVLELRRKLYGPDNAYSDALADALGIDEEAQRPGETEESYKARQARVDERRARLGLKEK